MSHNSSGCTRLSRKSGDSSGRAMASGMPKRFSTPYSLPSVRARDE
jgi:hypothetical protein